MYRSCVIFFALIVPLTAPAADDPAAWQSLFNGKNLDGWVNVNTAPETWRVQDGMIVCSGQPRGFLRTEEAYENYVLELQWRHMDEGGNAGVMVHADPLPQIGAPYPESVEVQVKDGDGGSMFGIRGCKLTPITNPLKAPRPRARPTENRTRPAGQWNDYRLTSHNGTLELAVNGKVVTRAVDATQVKGHICLEAEHSEVHLRNIRIQKLPSSDPPSRKTADQAEDYTSLFDGVSLRGWQQTKAIEGRWEVDDGVIRLPADQPPRKRGEDDNLWTEQSYHDFVLLVDWRLTEQPVRREMNAFTADGLFQRDEDGLRVKHEIMHAGDSGIILRGDPRAQVNIWSQPMGSGDINPYHKDAQLPPAIRKACMPKTNADHRPGRWNRFEIRMRDDRVSVILNGTEVIENATLPGVATAGPIGLQNHGDGIEFRNLLIRPFTD